MMRTKMVPHEGFLIEYFENDCLATSSIEVGKKWESHILHFVHLYKKKMGGVRNILDIGANFGYHTLFFAREVADQNGTVFAFEPQIQNYMLLHKNIQHNHLTNVQTIPQACSDKLDIVHLPLFDPQAHHPINMGDITLNQPSSPQTHLATTIPIDSMVIPPIDLIKMDVQGWEINALRGAKEMIQRDHPLMIVEFEEHQLVKTGNNCYGLASFLREMGYHIFFLDYHYPSDHVCVHVSKLEKFREVFGEYIKEHTVFNPINYNIHYGVTEKIVLSFD